MRRLSPSQWRGYVARAADVLYLTVLVGAALAALAVFVAANGAMTSLALLALVIRKLHDFRD